MGTILKKSPLTQKWVDGKISNFQYLIHLNTLAGMLRAEGRREKWRIEKRMQENTCHTSRLSWAFRITSTECKRKQRRGIESNYVGKREGEREVVGERGGEREGGKGGRIVKLIFG